VKRKKLSLSDLNRPDIASFKKTDKTPLVIVADNIRSGMNVGSLFRTCDAFAVEKLLITGISAKPPHKEITKTAIGATESVKWAYVDDIIQELTELRSAGYTIIAIEQTNDAIPLSTFRIEKEGKYVLIFGNEVNGVTEELINISDSCIEIIQYGTKHSINVSVCAGIVIWTFVSKLLN
jgi:tRNA G18 (ribose-2'-O)-methylase SpoU